MAPIRKRKRRGRGKARFDAMGPGVPWAPLSITVQLKNEVTTPATLPGNIIAKPGVSVEIAFSDWIYLSVDAMQLFDVLEINNSPKAKNYNIELCYRDPVYPTYIYDPPGHPSGTYTVYEYYDGLPNSTQNGIMANRALPSTLSAGDTVPGYGGEVFRLVSMETLKYDGYDSDTYLFNGASVFYKDKNRTVTACSEWARSEVLWWPGPRTELHTVAPIASFAGVAKTNGYYSSNSTFNGNKSIPIPPYNDYYYNGIAEFPDAAEVVGPSEFLTWIQIEGNCSGTKITTDQAPNYYNNLGIKGKGTIVGFGSIWGEYGHICFEDEADVDGLWHPIGILASTLQGEQENGYADVFLAAQDKPIYQRTRDAFIGNH